MIKEFVEEWNLNKSELDELPSKGQVKDLMTIFLHLLQNCVKMKEGEMK